MPDFLFINLRSLSEPLIPPSSITELTSLVEEKDSTVRVGKLKKAVSEFPLENRCVLHFLTEV